MKPPTGACTRLVRTDNPDALLLYEYAHEIWNLASHLEYLLEEVAPDELEAFRRSRHQAAQTSQDGRTPLWSANHWKPPSKEVA